MTNIQKFMGVFALKTVSVLTLLLPVKSVNEIPPKTPIFPRSKNMSKILSTFAQIISHESDSGLCFMEQDFAVELYAYIEQLEKENAILRTIQPNKPTE